MRIIFLTHNMREDNGGGVFSRHLIEGIQKAISAEVRIFVSEPSGFSGETPIPTGFFYFLQFFFLLRRTIKKSDLMHAIDGYPYAVLAALASVWLSTPLVITAIGSGSILPLYQWRHAWLLGWAYRRAHRVVAISSFTKKEVVARVPGLSVSVITPGVNVDDIDGAQKSEECGAPQQYRPYLLSVGALRWRKGYKLSIRAFARVAKEFPQLQYVIIGKRYSDHHYEKLQEVIREEHLEGKVHILEHIERKEDLYCFYGSAELFFLMSQNAGHDVEGFGIVFLEAAVSGLPVVGSRDCGVEDAMREGGNGFLADGTEPEQFADAILRILRDPALKEKMSNTSSVFAETFRWEGKIQEYKNLYRVILSQ